MTVNFCLILFSVKTIPSKVPNIYLKKSYWNLKYKNVCFFYTIPLFTLSTVIHRHFPKNNTLIFILLRCTFRKKIKRTKSFYWKKVSDELYTSVCIASVCKMLFIDVYTGYGIQSRHSSFTFFRDIFLNFISQSTKMFLTHAIVHTPRVVHGQR